MLGASSQVSVRKAKVADRRALADVFSHSWQHAYRGVIPHLHLESMIRKRGPDWWGNAIRSGESVLVLEVGGVVGGYATWGAARTRGLSEGEIYELYLEPTYQGLGFGELLFESCRHVLDCRKMRGLIVWALSENTGAREFYLRRGGRPVAKSFDRFGGVKLEKTGFIWA